VEEEAGRAEEEEEEESADRCWGVRTWQGKGERGGAVGSGAEEDDESTTAATAATTYTRSPGRARAGAKLVAGFELKKED